MDQNNGNETSPRSPNEILQHSELIEELSDELPTPEEVEVALGELLSNLDGDSLTMSYEVYCSYREKVVPKISDFLTPWLFLSLNGGFAEGKVSAADLYYYISRKILLERRKIDIMLYSYSEPGYITQDELNKYFVNELNFDEISEDDQKDYALHATKWFTFFSQPKSQRKLSIIDLLSKKEFDELHSFRIVDIEEDNWFSFKFQKFLKSKFYEHDEDGDQMLNMCDFIEINPIQLSEDFVQQCFLEYGIGADCMTFESYLDFFIAMGNQDRSEALAYFFNIIDVDKDGFIGYNDLYCMLRNIYGYLSSQNLVACPLDVIIDEMFDMILPKKKRMIAKKEFVYNKNSIAIIQATMSYTGYMEFESKQNHPSNNEH